MVYHIWKNQADISLFHMIEFQSNPKFQTAFYYIHEFHCLMEMGRLVLRLALYRDNLFFCIFVNQVHPNNILLCNICLCIPFFWQASLVFFDYTDRIFKKMRCIE